MAGSCGGSGTRNAPQTNAGTGPSGGSGSGSAGPAIGGDAGSGKGGKVGGAGSQAGTGTSGVGAASGGERAGGAGGSGAAEGGGDGAGGASQGPLGIECDAATCMIGQACVFCVTEDSSVRICVPHPERDATGYAAATEACASQPTQSFDDCDGPEDCEPHQFCVARAGADSFMRCRDMPSTLHSCCFDCGALADCTICRNDRDCPDGETCSRAIRDGFKGCDP